MRSAIEVLFSAAGAAPGAAAMAVTTRNDDAIATSSHALRFMIHPVVSQQSTAAAHGALA
jgi:hypothetical protein